MTTIFVSPEGDIGEEGCEIVLEWADPWADFVLEVELVEEEDKY
jgi:hypothetical protein